MNLSDYRLSQGSFFCLADDYLVFSNIDNDKYHCLNLKNTQIFLSWLANLRGGHPQIDNKFDSNQAPRIVLALTRQGLLVDSRSEASRPLQAAGIPAPVDELVGHSDIVPAGNHKYRALRFFQASFCASYKLRAYPLRQILRGVERRRQQSVRPSDSKALQAAVTTFGRLRPYYPRAYLCRFDSLALIEFLASYGHYPLWVFGVKSKPFGAHCWVQEGGLVLNDRLDYVKRFTRIMAF